MLKFSVSDVIPIDSMYCRLCIEIGLIDPEEYNKGLWYDYYKKAGQSTIPNANENTDHDQTVHGSAIEWQFRQVIHTTHFPSQCRMNK